MVAQSTMSIHSHQQSCLQTQNKNKKQRTVRPFHGFTHTRGLNFFYLRAFIHLHLHPSSACTLLFIHSSATISIIHPSAHHSSDSGRISESEGTRERDEQLCASPLLSAFSYLFVDNDHRQCLLHFMLSHFPLCCVYVQQQGTRTWCPKCNLSGSCIVSVACLKRTCLPSLPLHCEWLIFYCTPQTPCSVPVPGYPHQTCNSFLIIDINRANGSALSALSYFSIDSSFVSSIHPHPFHPCSSHKDSKARAPKSIDWQKILR